jgi:dienelactone hydrolase
VTRPFTFSTWNETLVDTSRPTEVGAQTPGAPQRSLVTTIYLPDEGGRRPLIVFSHGLTGHPDKFTHLLSAWARAGYVVAAPAFPTTNDRVPGAPQNYAVSSGQPGDVRFVLDEVLRLADDPDSALHERVDPDRIGAGGLSLGGGTTYSVAFGGCCPDDRIKAAEVLAGATFPLEGPVVLDGRIPLLIAHGDQDPVLRYERAREAFDQSPGPVWLVTLLGASHATAFENDVTPHDAMVERFTTDFWDATIGGDAGAWTTFEQDAVVEGLSTLEQK